MAAESTNNSASPPIRNNTIVANNASYGGGIYCGSAYPQISNNVVAFNSSGIYKNSTGTLALRNNCVHNPGGPGAYNYSGLSAGTGDISLDPLFVNRPAGDYHLASGSPCIDAGYNASVPSGTLTDLNGHARFVNDPATPDCQWAPGTCGNAPIVDMGAYEFIPLIPGDYDRDGDIDLDDLAVFQACVSGPGVA
jgi:hypothetical protein